MEELKVCTAYKINGSETTFFPSDVSQLAKAECVYETVPGWEQDLTKMTSYEDLPTNTRNYVAIIEDIVKKPVSIVGVGPKRSQALFSK